MCFFHWSYMISPQNCGKTIGTLCFFEPMASPHGQRFIKRRPWSHGGRGLGGQCGGEEPHGRLRSAQSEDDGESGFCLEKTVDEFVCLGCFVYFVLFVWAARGYVRVYDSKICSCFFLWTKLFILWVFEIFAVAWDRGNLLGVLVVHFLAAPFFCPQWKNMEEVDWAWKVLFDILWYSFFKAIQRILICRIVFLFHQLGGLAPNILCAPLESDRLAGLSLGKMKSQTSSWEQVCLSWVLKQPCATSQVSTWSAYFKLRL